MLLTVMVGRRMVPTVDRFVGRFALLLTLGFAVALFLLVFFLLLLFFAFPPPLDFDHVVTML